MAVALEDTGSCLRNVEDCKSLAEVELVLAEVVCPMDDHSGPIVVSTQCSRRMPCYSPAMMVAYLLRLLRRLLPPWKMPALVERDAVSTDVRAAVKEMCLQRSTHPQMGALGVHIHRRGPFDRRVSRWPALVECLGTIVVDQVVQRNQVVTFAHSCRFRSLQMMICCGF